MQKISVNFSEICFRHTLFAGVWRFFVGKGIQGKMDQTYMKDEKILPLIAKMSLPMVISMLVNSMYNIVDSFFVAKISEDAMTALSLVFPIQNLINSAMIGFGIGVNAAISYFLGAGNKEEAERSASQGIMLSTFHGIFLTVVCIFGMKYFLRLFTADAVLIGLGTSYSDIAFAFSVVIAWQLCFCARRVLQAPDVPVSACKRRCSGNASYYRIQLRSKGIPPCAQDILHRYGNSVRDNGSRNCAVAHIFRTADSYIHRKCGYCHKGR